MRRTARRSPRAALPPEARDHLLAEARLAGRCDRHDDVATIEMETSTQPVANVSMEVKKLDTASN